MKWLLFIVLLMVSHGVAEAVTFTVETQSGTDISTSVVTIDAPVINGSQSVEGSVADLISKIGVEDTLAELSTVFERISDGIMTAITADPIDQESLLLHSKDLVDLALRLQVYMLAQQLSDFASRPDVEDSWFSEIVFNN